MSRLTVVRVLRWLLLAVPLVPALSSGVVAFAFWTAPGAGTASASSGTLAVPTGVTATATATRGTVAVSWTGATGPDGHAVTRYRVQRLAGTTPSDACGTTATSPLTSPPTSCSDTGVADGTYTYVVTAVYHSWTAAGAASGAVTVVPHAPASVTLVNGGGTGGAYIDSANRASISIDVGLNATSLSTDTVTLSLHDTGSVHTLTRTAAATAGAGTVHLTGLDLSTLTDGTITIGATSTDLAGNASAAVSITPLKDTVAPSTSVKCNNTTCQSTYVLSSVAVAITATDAGSGLASITYTRNGAQTTVNSSPATFTQGGILGSYTVTYFATDVAGNVSSTSQFSFTIIL